MDFHLLIVAPCLPRLCWHEDNQRSFEVVVDEKKGDTAYVRLDNPSTYYNDEFLEKRMERWIENPSSRFEPIEIPINEEDRERFGIKGPRYLGLTGYNTAITTMQTTENKVVRRLTWTDIFYMAAMSQDIQCSTILVL